MDSDAVLAPFVQEPLSDWGWNICSCRASLPDASAGPTSPPGQMRFFRTGAGQRSVRIFERQDHIPKCEW